MAGGIPQVERIRRYVRGAVDMGLTVHGFEVEGRKIRILTAPVSDAKLVLDGPEEDEVARWLAAND